MDTLLLRNFLVLAKTRNFTKAAQTLYCSQSALSLQIARLEALIGKTLFNRNKRNVSLTLEGEQLLGYAQQILCLEEDLLNHFRQPSITGEITFGTPEDLATTYLPNILARFVETYPAVFLNVHCELTMHLLKGFNAHHYDIVLIKQDPQNPDPRSEEVWKESLVWVHQKNEKPFSWKKEVIPLVLAPAPCVYRRRAIEALNKQGIRWRIVYTSPSLTGTFAAVKAGLGISILPVNMVPKELSVVQDLPLLKDTQIALLKQTPASEAARALADYIINQMVSNTKL